MHSTAETTYLDSRDLMFVAQMLYKSDTLAYLQYGCVAWRLHIGLRLRLYQHLAPSYQHQVAFTWSSRCLWAVTSSQTSLLRPKVAVIKMPMTRLPCFAAQHHEAWEIETERSTKSTTTYSSTTMAGGDHAIKCPRDLEELYAISVIWLRLFSVGYWAYWRDTHGCKLVIVESHLLHCVNFLADLMYNKRTSLQVTAR